MYCVVDTNVAVVANGKTEQASPDCVLACFGWLNDIMKGQHMLVIDDSWHILGEYGKNLRSEGQPGAGDAFLKWVLVNRDNPRHCEQVPIEPDPEDNNELIMTDRSDRKFVAVVLAHPQRPPILNATDSDWWECRKALAARGIHITYVCPDAMPEEKENL